MPRKKSEAPKVSETKKKPVAKKPVAKPKATTKKPVAKPKATTKKPVAKPKATTKKPVTRKKPTPKPKEVEYVVLNREEEFPHAMFPWKLIYKEGVEKRTCYFQCEEHRKKHIMRYNLNKKDIIFMGYKYD